MLSEDVSWIRYLVGSVLTAIIFTAISGNVLVCWAICADRRLRKLGNLFIVSLAVADLLVSGIVMTFALANDLMGYWAFGPQFCDAWIAMDVMCSTASILNLCAISLDRFIHIKDPLRYCRWMSKRVVLAVIAAMWMLSAMVSFVPISLGWHRSFQSESIDEMIVVHTEGRVEIGSAPPEALVLESNGTLNWTELTFVTTSSMVSGTSTGSEVVTDLQRDLHQPKCEMDLTKEYAVSSSLISFCIPCMVMIALYCRLYFYARKHVKSIRALNKPLNGGAVQHQAHDHKAAVTLGIIVGVFLFCWVPFFAVNIAAPFCKTCIPEIVFKVLTWLGYFNSALNPIIYSIFNTEFRDAFRKIITTHFLVFSSCSQRDSIRSRHAQHQQQNNNSCNYVPANCNLLLPIHPNQNNQEPRILVKSPMVESCQV
ncbi:dopamine receptor 1-like isoform X2 [Varroa jacobsoni]|nr:dopamine receptor 1-like isoform X2 [Varroa destructor]XP_022645111.1 dopamine receptor 1-like isoform X2 [Varroa destructor]XP_022645118.1 dopamine receptor 1-like isoform X2 [Varroa destructor]XP_022645127.1 dopamine receptor 1-like isoform X2 [Varroa destructor]XP_022692213.1 dopamine receptor 1-like isoform X2 [Varroa jacobsoni]XP_022692214.1 dopamine receptor 1-like isoform X2 [Varroa jacobsoni]